MRDFTDANKKWNLLIPLTDTLPAAVTASNIASASSDSTDGTVTMAASAASCHRSHVLVPNTYCPELSQSQTAFVPPTKVEAHRVVSAAVRL